MASRRTALSEEDQLEKTLQGARTLLAQKGAVAASKLGPPKLRPQAIATLLREGFEAAGKGVRVPLLAQGKNLLALGHPIPLTQLAKRLGGASAGEAKQLAKKLNEGGDAQLVLRGKQLVLLPAGEKTLPRSALRPATAELKSLLDWLKKAQTDKLEPTVLLSDLIEALQELQGTLGLSATKTAPVLTTPAIPKQTSEPAVPDLHVALRGAILALRDEDSSQAWVPDVSRRLRERASAEQVKDALLRSFGAGELELRPEGGIGRLSDDNAALCPTGAGGVPLSWVRLRSQAEN